MAVSVNKVLVDAAAGYLATKGGGVHVEVLGEQAWEVLFRTLLDEDPRFVDAGAGTYELAANRERREKALAAG
jgi:hypothetical protein